MKMLVDGKYLTVPIHGPATRTRCIEVVNGAVKIDGRGFTQDDFFKVNRLVKKESSN